MEQAEVFWGELAPAEHYVQIYNESDAMLDTLEGFVAGGLRAGESVIIIATPIHLNALDARLLAQGIDLKTARANNQYITRDAAETLAQFMVNGWPDDKLFCSAVADLLELARANGRKVRAFGEMVAILWANGQQAATVRLEHLWHQFCNEQQFSLFCAYPRAGFTQDAESSIAEICKAHSHVLSN